MGINNKFQLPNSNPAQMTNQGVVNHFVKSLQQYGGVAQGRSYGPRNFNISRFYSNGNFTVPAGVTVLSFFMGSGGGGGGSSGVSGNYGGDGANGQVLSGSVQVSPGDVISIVIGGGGATAPATGGNGGPGEDTSLSFGGGTTIITCTGGGGGVSSGQGGDGGQINSTFGSLYPSSSFYVPLVQVYIPGFVGGIASVPYYMDFYNGGNYIAGGGGSQNYVSGAGKSGVVYLSWS